MVLVVVVDGGGDVVAVSVCRVEEEQWEVVESAIRLGWRMRLLGWHPFLPRWG